MSFIKESRAYSSLTPDQKQFIEDKYIEASRTPSEWLTFFGKIAEYDRYGDSGRRFLKKTGCASTVAFFASIVISIIFETFIPLLIVLPVALLSVSLYFIKKRSDLPNNFRQCLVPLVSILREEMRSGEQLFLHLDLRGRTHESKEVSGRQSPGARMPGRLGGTVKETYYSDQWIAGRAVLADCSRLEWSIRDYTRKRTVTRRNPRGKYKTKTKYKIKSLIEARLQLPQEDYVLVSAGAGGGDKVNLKPGEKRNAVRVRRVVRSDDLESVLSLNHVLDVVARAYRQVAPNKAGGK